MFNSDIEKKPNPILYLISPRLGLCRLEMEGVQEKKKRGGGTEIIASRLKISSRGVEDIIGFLFTVTIFFFNSVERQHSFVRFFVKV